MRPNSASESRSAVAKYTDHLPLERQVRMMAREGLIVDSQTLWDQLNAIAHHLEVEPLRQISLLVERENQRLLMKTLVLTAENARLRGLPNPEQLALAELRALEQRRAQLLRRGAVDSASVDNRKGTRVGFLSSIERSGAATERGDLLATIAPYVPARLGMRMPPANVLRTS